MKIYDYDGQKNVAGERIRERRLKLRLSQAALAAKAQVEGVTLEQDSVSRIESGTRILTDYELMILARVLGVTADWLLDREK